MTRQQYTTSDTSIAATLSVLGHEVVSLETEKRGKILFVFNDNVDLRENIDKYWSHELKIDPMAFSQALKQLKGRLHDSQRNA